MDVFRRAPGGAAVVKLGSRERLLLRQLVVELQVRLGGRPAYGGPPGGAASAATAAQQAEDELFAALEVPVADSAGGARPSDPVVARLFPDAYSPEVELGQASRDFRRFTEGELMAAKVAGANTLLAALADERRAKVVVPAGDIQTWLYALNDLRLYLGVDLEVDELGQHPRYGEPGFARYHAYVWLTTLQASLVEVAAR